MEVAAMTVEIKRPETEARIRRYLRSGEFRDVDELLARALDALPEPPGADQPGGHTGQALVDAFSEIRGLLTDEEIDQLFRRNPSTARSLDLS
jgi:hypothetical protein